VLSPIEALASIPIEPAICDASSVNISPNKFSCHHTSNLRDLLINQHCWWHLQMVLLLPYQDNPTLLSETLLSTVWMFLIHWLYQQSILSFFLSVQRLMLFVQCVQLHSGCILQHHKLNHHYSFFLFHQNKYHLLIREE
jgi:hypothetical protein